MLKSEIQAVLQNRWAHPSFVEFFLCGPSESARGQAHSKTLRVIREASDNAKRFGVRRPSGAFLSVNPDKAGMNKIMQTRDNSG
jgi:hypothetical protein